MSALQPTAESGGLTGLLGPGGSAGRPVPGRRINRGRVMLGPRLQKGRTTAGLRELADGELLTTAAGGDADAFEVIYDRHAGAAFSLALRICRDRGVAEDVVQDAFLSLWRGRDRYDAARGQLRSWLLQIVHNSAIDRMRRGGVQERRRAGAEGIEDRLEAPDRTEEEVARREQAAEVRDALRTLPDEQRQAIELAYFEGLTHTQIAAKLGQPVGTIKGRMRLGLVKLQAQLAGELAGKVGG